jgi:polysaccharide biosynthesis transport protein
MSRHEVARFGNSPERFREHAYPAERPPARAQQRGMELDLRSVKGILSRRWRWGLRIFITVVALTVLATLIHPPMYRATGLVEIRGGDENNDSEVASVGALLAGRDPTEELLRTHFGLLRSTTLMRRVINTLRLDTLEEFASDDSGDKARTKVVQKLLDRLTIDPVEESRLVSVGFDDPDPALAARVVNTLLDQYEQSRVDEYNGTVQRLGHQVDSAEVALKASEGALRDYADAHHMPYLVNEDVDTEMGTRFTEMRAELAKAREDRIQKQSRYQMIATRGASGIADDEVLTQLKVQLADLEKSYARLSQTFTDAYPEAAQAKEQIREVERLIAQQYNKLENQAATDYHTAEQREALLQNAIASDDSSTSAMASSAGRYHVLRQAVTSNRTLYADLQKKQREAQVAAAMGATELAVVDRAVPPLDPSRPVFVVNLALAIMLGVVLGVGGSFVAEYADDTVRTGEELSSASELPVLAMIPSLAVEEGSRKGAIGGGRTLLGVRGRAGGSGRWPRIDDSESDQQLGGALVDAFGSLRTAVLFSPKEAAPHSILVTSCRAGEGKTTVAVNLALSLATLGRRVLLVDADLRRPSVHRALNAPRGPGLVQHLREGRGWKEMVRSSRASGLHLLPSGGPTAHAGDLLAAGGLEPFITEAGEYYDFVVVDAPALFINASDARVVSHVVDGVVAVVRSQETPRELVNRISEVVPNVIGLVINDLSAGALPDFFGDYFAGYGEGPVGGSRSGRR